MYNTAKSAHNTTALIEQCDIRLEPIHDSFCANASWCCCRMLIEVCHPDKMPSDHSHSANELTKHLYDARTKLTHALRAMQR